MNFRFSKQQIPAGNPLANALVIIVGALAIGASLILGVVALIILGSIVLILAAVIGIRVWWLNRRMSKGLRSGKHKESSQQIDIIEGEYRVISSDPETDHRSRE